ncbi:flagellar hook capping protein [Caloramator sp. E03]|uniref:flagellar hook capping FlgD N-terminal domain-containing protein n=1 Tax=Caloramator sp. E03 TaxID=2576307 RepID=UPI0011101C6C|nr:flagellar hook capping FlgD N-terminal domain-containing protein [Caloramator sp. E03]QCX32347.1 flagellar hook capping protein [Caloramator sp. E03]
MEVSSVSSNVSTTRTVTNNIVDKDAFLKILTVELSNQDPLNATDNTEYISQLAQFTALEQMQNLNSNFEKMLLLQKFTEGAMLIGKNVEFSTYDSSGNATTVNEIVKSVKIGNDNIYLITDSNQYSIDDVVGVGDAESDK